MVQPTHESERISDSEPHTRFASFRAALFCGLVGALIAVVPHMASKAFFGTWEFHQDFDEVVYRLISKPAMDGAWKMRDVFVQSDRNLPTTYSWMQFVPTSHLATSFGFDNVSVGQFWRLTGGFLMGLSLYIVFASFRLPVSRPLLFAVLAAVLALSDAGFVQGRVLVQNFLIAGDYVRWQPTKPHATNFSAYRVISPILSLPFSLLAAAFLAPNVLKLKPRLALLGALFTALSVTLYFFQWTALCVGAGACLSAFVIYDLFERSASLRTSMLALAALGFGVLLGAPQIFYNAMIFSDPALDPILERIGRGQAVPPGDPLRFVNLFNYWVWLKIAIAAAVVIRFRHRGMLLFAAIGFAGYALANSAIITRLEFENWHWLYVFSPFLAVPVYAGFVAVLMSRFGARFAVVVVCLFFLSAITLRSMEVKLAPESMLVRSIAEDVDVLRPIVAEIPDDGRTAMVGYLPSHVLALSMPGGRLLYHFPYASQISLMSLEEVYERIALTHWLTGMTRDRLADMPDEQVSRVQLAKQTRPEWAPDVTRSALLAVFDRLESEPAFVRSMMDKYQPNWLLLDKRSHVNPPVRGGSWERIAESQNHLLWKRKPD